MDNWSGNVLLAEAPESIEDEGNRIHLSKEKAGRIAFCLLVAGVLVIQAGMFGWMFASGMFSLTAGAVVTTR